MGFWAGVGAAAGNRKPRGGGGGRGLAPPGLHAGPGPGGGGAAAGRGGPSQPPAALAPRAYVTRPAGAARARGRDGGGPGRGGVLSRLLRLRAPGVPLSASLTPPTSSGVSTLKVFPCHRAGPFPRDHRWRWPFPGGGERPGRPHPARSLVPPESRGYPPPRPRASRRARTVPFLGSPSPPLRPGCSPAPGGDGPRGAQRRLKSGERRASEAVPEGSGPPAPRGARTGSPQSRARSPSRLLPRPPPPCEQEAGGHFSEESDTQLAPCSSRGSRPPNAFVTKF